MSEESSTENKCSSCGDKSIACISYFAHENAMMHKDMDNERLHETIKLMSEQHAQDIKRMSEQHSTDIRNILIGFFVVIMLFAIPAMARYSMVRALPVRVSRHRTTKKTSASMIRAQNSRLYRRTRALLR